MLAVELDQPGANVVTDCMNEGILINCIQQSTIRFLPPLIITRKEIDLLITTLSKIFTKM
jgi:acetylornithine/succinyldiaminopimelate/putrescine aminotransferase